MAGTDGETEYLGQTTYPSNPETGRRVFRTDIDGGTLMRYNGSTWVALGGNVNDIPVQTGAPSAPTSPSTLTGLWYDSDHEPFATADYSSIGIRSSKTGSQSIPVTAWTVLTGLNASISKSTGGWTYSGNGWVIPQSGWYYAHARVHWAAYGSGNFRYHRITINGSGLGDVAEEFSGLSTSFATQGSQLFYATAGDIIGVDAYQDAAAAVNVTWANIEIALVGGTQGPKGDTGDVFAVAGTIIGRAYRTTTIVTSGTGWTDVPMTNYDTAEGITYDSVNGEWTVVTPGWYMMHGRIVGTFSDYSSVRILADKQDGAGYVELTGSTTEHSSASSVRRTSTITNPEWLPGGTQVKLSAAGNTTTLSADSRLAIWSVAGVQGPKGDKGDTGNLPIAMGAAMHHNTTFSVTGGGATGNLGCNTTDYDTDSIITDSGSSFTIPVGAGDGQIWHFDAQVPILTAAGDDIRIRWSKNGGTTESYESIHSLGGSAYGCLSANLITQADEGDVFTCKVYNGGSTRNVGGANAWEHLRMSCALVGGPKGDKGDAGNLPLNSGVNIGRTTNFSCPSGAWTKCTGFDYNANWVDDNNDFTVNADDITVENDGYYDIFMKGFWANNNTGTLRGLRITINGTLTIEEFHDGTDGYGFGFYQNASRTWYLSAGDTVGMYLYQDSGGAMNWSSAAFSIVRVGGPKGDKGDAGYVPEGDTAWRTPTFLNSWVNYDTTTYGPVGYRKDGDGVVHIQGLVKNGSSGTANIFTLPVGYRPSVSLIFSGMTASGAGDFRINKNGVVAYTGTAATSTAWSSLACSFKVAD